MKKISFFMIATLMSAGAFAEPPAMPDGQNPGGPAGRMMQNLTDEQKSCLAQYECTSFMTGEKPDGKPDSKPGDKPENMPAADSGVGAPDMDSQRECMQNAFKSCGVEMPSAPEMGGGAETR